MARRTTKRVLITLHFLSLSVPELIEWAFASVARLAVDPDVTNPVVSINDLTQQVSELRTTSHIRLLNRSKSLTSLQNAQLNVVLNSFTYIANQVENIANTKATANGGDENVARQLMRRLLFKPKEEAVREGSYFKVVETGPGWVFLQTKAAPRNSRAIYYWRYSTTPYDANSWSAPLSTTGSAIIMEGLPLRDTRYYFQCCVIIVKGRKPKVNVNHDRFEWEDPISGLVC